jgi:hypothetical protein
VGYISCHGQYKVSEEEAKLVNDYWRRRFHEERHAYEQECRRKRLEEAIKWELKKMRKEEGMKENEWFGNAHAAAEEKRMRKREDRMEKEWFGDVFHAEEKRRREIKLRLSAGQQKLRLLANKIREIEAFINKFTMADDYAAKERNREIEDARFALLYHEHASLLAEYDSLSYSINKSRQCASFTRH